jgi:hypothetical protein
MSAISRLLIVNIFPVWNYIDMEAFNEEQRCNVAFLIRKESR